MDVAQLVRASVCGTEGCGFKSHLPPQTEFHNPLFLSSSPVFLLHTFLLLSKSLLRTPYLILSLI